MTTATAPVDHGLLWRVCQVTGYRVYTPAQRLILVNAVAAVLCSPPGASSRC